MVSLMSTGSGLQAEGEERKGGGRGGGKKRGLGGGDESATAFIGFPPFMTQFSFNSGKLKAFLYVIRLKLTVVLCFVD